MRNKANEPLWVEKYRPSTIEECILPENLKKTFQSYVDNGMIPNLLLTGKPGMGKTTVARAMLEQLDIDYMIINASMSGGIDTLRTDIQRYASSMSLDGKRKYIILDEADYLNPSSTQPALRNFMEEFSKNCVFILTCNLSNRILDALKSRTSTVDFNIPKKEMVGIAGQFLKRMIYILQTENVEYDKTVLVELIKKHLPDWRKCINDLQRYGISGKIDVGVLSSISDDSFKSLVKHLKEKDFTSLRKWVAQNNDIDSAVLFRKVYDHSIAINMKPMDIAQLVMTLGEWQARIPSSPDKEILDTACLTDVMGSVDYG